MNRASSLILIFPIWHHSVVGANACTTTLMSGYKKKKNATVATLACMLMQTSVTIWHLTHKVMLKKKQVSAILFGTHPKFIAQ